MKLKLLFASFACLLSLGCMSAPDGVISDSERGRLGTYMVNLSSAVNMYFSPLAGPPTEEDAVLLRQATAHDPALLAPAFDPYLLRVQFQQPFAVLLLCTKDGRRAIMEDVGCSARLDRQVRGDAPCEFTLRVSKGCRVEGADPE